MVLPAAAVLALRHLHGKRRAGRELRRLAFRRALFETERRRLRHGKRDDPVFAQRGEVPAVDALYRHEIAVHAHDHPLVPVLRGHLRHDLVRVLSVLPPRAVVLASVRRNVGVVQPDVFQRPGADRRERALPYSALVVHRRVRVPRERDGVGEARKRRRRGAAVVAPRPRAVARVARMRMLEPEERARRVEPRRVGFDPPRRAGVEVCAGAALVAAPVRAREREAVDLLLPDRFVRFAEDLLPRSGQIRPDGLLLQAFPENLSRGAARPAVSPAFVVVVAVHEQALDLPAGRVPAAGERCVPRARHRLQLRNEPPVGHVAAYRHGVHAAPAEQSERLPELLFAGERKRAVLAARGGEMDVAHDAERDSGRHALKRAAGRAQRRRTAERPCCEKPFDEPSSRNVHFRVLPPSPDTAAVSPAFPPRSAPRPSPRLRPEARCAFSTCPRAAALFPRRRSRGLSNPRPRAPETRSGRRP